MTRTYGWKPDVPDFRDLLLAAPAPAVALPPEVNLEPLCPSVYDQGKFGSCTANATAAALEFDRMKQGLPVFTPSRFYEYWWTRFLEHDTSQDGGGQLRDAVKAVSKYGYLPEADWPYLPENLLKHPSIAACQKAAPNRPITYQRVAQTAAALKGCLASGFPVIFGFTVYESFESPAVAKTGIVPMPGVDEKPVGGHAVLLVGYTPDSWRVRNSWGSGWGQAGYCEMDKAYLLSRGLASDFWRVNHVPG
jgi:C1A family cysteine protease